MLKGQACSHFVSYISNSLFKRPKGVEIKMKGEADAEAEREQWMAMARSSRLRLKICKLEMGPATKAVQRREGGGKNRGVTTDNGTFRFSRRRKILLAKDFTDTVHGISSRHELRKPGIPR